MKKKEIKITEKEQRVAVDILQELEMWMMSRPGNNEPSDSEQQIYDILIKCFRSIGYLETCLQECAVQIENMKEV